MKKKAYNRSVNEQTANVAIANHENTYIVDRNDIIRELTKDQVKNESAVQRENPGNDSSKMSTNQDQTNLSGIITASPIRIPATNVSQPRTSAPTVENYARLSDCDIERSKYPTFTNKENRLASFVNWPSSSIQRPEEMVNAGFYYTGTKDICKCFCCGGGLKDWLVGELPWTEHARYFPKCPFVIHKKGKKFIENVQKGGNPEFSENITEKEQKKSYGGSHDYNYNPAVQAIIEFGYKSAVVNTAYRKLKESGILYITARLLLETVWESEDNHVTSDQTIISHDITAGKGADNEEHSNKLPENNEKIDPTLELSLGSLEEENKNFMGQETCKICLEEPVAIVFLPCRHLAACTNCAPALRRCPSCRAFIKGTVKAIMC